MKTLINLNGFLPGGYPYEQDGVKFPAESYNVSQQAKIVLDFRKANKKPRATFHETVEDIIQFNGRRLGFHERWFRDIGAKSFTQAHPQVAPRSGCGTCGSTRNR